MPKSDPNFPHGRAIRVASIDIGSSANPERRVLRLIKTKDAEGDTIYQWCRPNGSFCDGLFGSTVERAIESLSWFYQMPTWDLRWGR